MTENWVIMKTQTPKTQTSKTQTSKTQTPKTQTPRLKKKDLHFFFEKNYIVNSSQFLSPDNLWSRNVHRQPPERSDLFILSGLSLWHSEN